MTTATTIYLNIAGKGEYGVKYPSGYSGTIIYAQGGYNGGGKGCSRDSYSAGGGGATHIATRSGLLSKLENYKDTIIIVAGGGGGATDYSKSAAVGEAGNGGGVSGGGELPGTQTGTAS